MLHTEERPWGRFTNLLENEHCKVKEIVVNPGQRLSYQSHSKREEKWTVVTGVALVTLNEREIVLYAGDSVKIPKEAKHRVKNDGKEILKFIEIQTGEYFGEDDIIRYSDDYGRSDANVRTEV